MTLKEDRTQNQTRNTKITLHNSTISKTKEQMDYMSTVTGHLATNESLYKQVDSPPTNSPPSTWTSWWGLVGGESTSWWRDDCKPCQQRQSKKTKNDTQDKFNRGHNKSVVNLSRSFLFTLIFSHK